MTKTSITRTWGWKLAVATIGLTLVASCGLESGGALPLAVGPGSIEPVPELEGVKMTVGSKDFTEQIVLGYVIEFAMAAAGADVRDPHEHQGSNSTRDAQLNGQIDLAYEYTGTGWINYLGNETPLPDSQAQFEASAMSDLAANDMVWTDPAPMNNTYALAMSKETAEKTGVKTVSDYAKLGRIRSRSCGDVRRDRVQRPPGRISRPGSEIRFRRPLVPNARSCRPASSTRRQPMAISASSARCSPPTVASSHSISFCSTTISSSSRNTIRHW